MVVLIADVHDHQTTEQRLKKITNFYVVEVIAFNVMLIADTDTYIYADVVQAIFQFKSGHLLFAFVGLFVLYFILL